MKEEERLQKERQEEHYKRGKEVYEQNAKVREIKDEETKRRLAQDVALLRYAQMKERQQIEAEERQLLANRQAAMGYKKYLEEQMKRDAEDNAHLDEMRKIEEEKVWKARDDALNARQQARDELMKVVDEGRQDQIRRKAEERVRQQLADREWADKFADDTKLGLLKEKEAAEKRKQIAMQNNIYLKQQIDTQEERIKKEKQDEYLDNKHMERMERLHRQKLAEQGGVARTFRPLKQSQWYS